MRARRGPWGKRDVVVVECYEERCLTCKPIKVKSEHCVGKARSGTDQKEHLDQGQDVAGVQQQQHLALAQLEPQLQAVDECEKQEETMP